MGFVPSCNVLDGDMGRAESAVDHVWAKQRNPRGQFCLLFKILEHSGAFLLRRLLSFALFRSAELFGEDGQKDETQHHVFEFAAALRGGAWWCVVVPGRNAWQNGGCPPVGEFLVPGVKVTSLLSPVET